MNFRAGVTAGLARQLAHPQGVRGRLVGVLLNRGNRGVVTAAVQSLSLAPGGTAADIGFGGAVGLDLLLRSVGTRGHVHGVEVSVTMTAQAARRFRHDIAAGRLQLHAASMARLPMAAASLDGVITVNTIYFVAELEQAFAELARVTKSSGRVVVGLGDPEVMARLPYTRHGFRLRPGIRRHRRAGRRRPHRRGTPTGRSGRRRIPPVAHETGCGDWLSAQPSAVRGARGEVTRARLDA